jgi:cell division protein FtsB
MNQSRTKSKVTLIALSAIALVFLLLVVSIVEIVCVYKYKQQISKQEQQIEELQNAKDFYEDKLNELGYTNGDKIFEEE